MSKQIFIVLILALLASAGAWFLIDKQNTSQLKIGSLFSDIQPYAADIDEINIENNQGLVINAKRMASNDQGHSGQSFPIQASEVEEQRWFITNAAQSGLEFAADQKKLGALVSALINANLVEPKTTQSDNYSRLGLEAITQADSQAVKVSLKSKGKTWQVLIGNESSSGSGFYVRKPKEKQTWLSDQKFTIDETQRDWLNSALFNFSADNIRLIKRLDEEQWSMEKTTDNNGQFQLIDRQDSDLKYDTVLNIYAESLATLGFESLVAKDDPLWSSLQPIVELELETFAGDKYQLAMAENDDGHYIKITSSVDSEFWNQWLFGISNYTKTQLNKFHGDFLADESPPEAE